MRSPAARFKDDMTKYGAAYPDDVRFYEPLMEKMSKTIDEKNAALAQADAKVAKLESDFAVREANKQPQIDDFKAAADKAQADLNEQISTFKSDRGRITDEQDKLKTDLDSARKEATAALDKLDKRLKTAMDQYLKLRMINRNLADQQAQLTAQKFDVPEGQILWVNQRTGMAWIDLGRADTLQRQVTFGIYPSNLTDLASVGKKASIEVTQILGDHLAEGHIFDDKMVDPVLPGDKIFTPVWTPGEKRHFAISGHIELNQSGRDDLPTLMSLITMNGGVIDSYLDDKGKVHGEITVKTRYFVVGDEPSDKSQPALRDGFTKMRNEAERFGVQKIDLSDLLLRMGWKNQTPVVEYGRGMNPRDFAAKSNEEVRTKSTGSVSDVFQPRNVPTRVPTSAYSAPTTARLPCLHRLPLGLILSAEVVMPNALPAASVMDREFLGIRGRLIELAAALDRIDRLDRAASEDPRCASPPQPRNSRHRRPQSAPSRSNWNSPWLTMRSGEVRRWNAGNPTGCNPWALRAFSNP